MKKFVLFLLVASSLYIANAQDTIPFLDPCFSYPQRDSLVGFDGSAIEADGFPNECRWKDTCEGSLNGMFQLHLTPQNSPILGIAVTADTSIIPSPMYWAIFAPDGLGVRVVDSIDSKQLPFKTMYYTYYWGGEYDNLTTEGTISVPCFIYLFSDSMYVADTFYIGLDGDFLSQHGYRYRSMACRGRTISYLSSDYYGVEHSDLYFNYEWGGAFPILELPCPPPSLPRVTDSHQGNIGFGWSEGDTNRYQVMISSYNSNTTLYISDTLTDNSFRVTDSLMDALALAEGRYKLCYRKVCDYMDSPYHTLVWSGWSPQQQFYYAHGHAGIGDVQSAPLDFQLAPNPATGSVAVTLPATAVGGQLTLTDLAGRRIKDIPVPSTQLTLDLASLAPGTYLLTLTAPQGTATQRLVVR